MTPMLVLPLESGNKKYGGISEEYLDFSGGSMCGSNVMYCNEKINKINKDANTLPLEEFKKKYGESWEKTNDFLMNEIFSEKNNSKNTGNGNNSGKNTTANSGGKTNNTSKGSTVKNCDDECQTDFTNSMNSIGIENSQEKYSYYPAYDPEKAAANAEFRGVLANAGIILMASGVPAGGILVVPKALDYLGGSIYSFQDGDIEGGLQNLAGLATLGIITGSLYQNSNTSLAQTTSKENNKFFNKGDGRYTLENGTSEGYLSGNDFVRVNYVNGIPTNAYGRIDGNTVMLDRTSSGVVSGTSLISSGITNVLGLPGTSQTNVGSLTYTPTEVRPSQIFISNPVTGVTEVFHNGLSGLIPTYSPPTDGIIYNQHPYYGFYPATDISTLNNTSIFKEGALPHILDGDVKVTINQQTGLPRDKVSGYHSNTITGIPTIDPSTIIVDPVTGVYKAKVINPISGTVKGGNQGYSTFFPDNWTAQQKVDAMNEAYNNRVFDAGNQYTGTYGNIKIRMYLDANKEVISAFPEF